MLNFSQQYDSSWWLVLTASPNILIFDTENILIDLRYILRKDYVIDHLPLVEDQLVKNYNRHNLYFYAPDGNDVLAPGFVAWIQRIQRGLHIPDSKINFLSVSPCLPQWHWIPHLLEAFEKIVQYIRVEDLPQDIGPAKFVGVLSDSRFSISRLRLVHSLDCAFPGDAFITFSTTNAKGFFAHNYSEYYQTELDWMSQRTFDNDMPDADGRIIDYSKGAVNYTKIWNQFHIEVITETDEYQNQWFTDKTAKCLLTGKPFVLLSGQYSLQNLKQLGFVTFDKWIDESYDDCVLPSQRINAIINSLQKLYLHPKKSLIIKKMYQHAKQNIDAYYDYVQKQIQLRTYTKGDNRWQEILRHTGREQVTQCDHNLRPNQK